MCGVTGSMDLGERVQEVRLLLAISADNSWLINMDQLTEGTIVLEIVGTDLEETAELVDGSATLRIGALDALPDLLDRPVTISLATPGDEVFLLARGLVVRA